MKGLISSTSLVVNDGSYLTVWENANPNGRITASNEQ